MISLNLNCNPCSKIGSKNTYQHYDEIINQSLNTCIILVGVGRINSIQGEVVKRGGGEGIFSKFRGELAKRGVKKFRGVWTLDEAMVITWHCIHIYESIRIRLKY